MKFKEIIDKILNEERNGGEFDRYQVEVGEDEGKHLFHFHLFHKDDYRKHTADESGNPPKNNWENLRNCWNAISDSKINCPMPNYKLLLRNYK